MMYNFNFSNYQRFLSRDHSLLELGNRELLGSFSFCFIHPSINANWEHGNAERDVKAAALEYNPAKSPFPRLPESQRRAAVTLTGGTGTVDGRTGGLALNWVLPLFQHKELTCFRLLHILLLLFVLFNM